MQIVHGKDSRHGRNLRADFGEGDGRRYTLKEDEGGGSNCRIIS